MNTIIRTAALSLALLLTACAPTLPQQDVQSSEWQLEIVDRRELAPDYRESGYALGYTVGRVEPEALSNDLLALGDEIVAAIAAYEMYMSHIPNIISRRFETTADLLDFIGYAPLRTPDIGLPLQKIDPELRTKPACVSVMGNNDGQISSVRYELWYESDTLSVQTFASICTTAYDLETRTGSWTTDIYTTTAREHAYPDGTTALIVESTPTDGDPDDRCMLDAYRILDDVLYRIHIPYLPADEATARAVLDRWLAALA